MPDIANTKAQVTIFIVAGLMILFTAGLFFIVATRQAEKPLQTN